MSASLFTPAEIDRALEGIPVPPNSVIAIDPGRTHSAHVFLDHGKIVERLIMPNQELLARLKSCYADAYVCEMIASYGMAVGRDIFETVLWIGRFSQACEGKRFDLVYRAEVKMHLCHSMRAKDANVRQALLDRFGGKEATRKGGALHGFRKDLWSALAVLVTFCDREGIEVKEQS